MTTCPDHEGSSEARSITAAELDRFRRVDRLRDHWARQNKGPAFYWYITFETCTELHSLVKLCRDGMPFPYYDFTAPLDLHMTLDRIAYVDEVKADLPATIAAAAAAACRDVPALEVNVGGLGGTPGALGLSAFPVEPLRHLRDRLRAATLSVYPSAPVKEQSFHPHVAIAYCNSEVPAAEAIVAVERLGALGPVAVTVSDVALVVLERRHRAYSWQAVTRAPLKGTGDSVQPVEHRTPG